ncbi:MAG: T9SS type A sorting domain-containing protein [Ignavibacteria bacterium]
MKILICILLTLFFSSQCYSQIFVENFDYPPGTIISTTPVWDIFNAGINPIKVFSPGLTLPYYAGSDIGNKVLLFATGEDVFAAITPNLVSGSVYVSFMHNLSLSSNFGKNFLDLCSTDNIFVARVYAKTAGGGYQLGITKSDEPFISYGSTIYTDQVSYLVIVKYVFNPGVNDDEVSLFVYSQSDPPPDIESFPTIGPFTGASTDAGNISRIILRQGSGPTEPHVSIDGIYIDTVWNQVLLPVELVSFNFSIIGRNVTLNWATTSETNNSHFEIERSSNDVWNKVGQVQGYGTTSISHNYAFADAGLTSGSYNYRLKQVDYNGNFEYFNLNNEVKINAPSNFTLLQNYPNPFNPSTKITFNMPSEGKVMLRIFDNSGKEIRTVMNKIIAAGYHDVVVNASEMPSGIYFYKIDIQTSTNNFVSAKKMILLK